MTGLFFRIGILGALLIGIALAGRALWQGVYEPMPPAPAAPPSIPPATRQDGAAFEAAPLTAFPETLKRPLFFEGRRFPTPRPQPSPAADVQPPPPATPQVEPATQAKAPNDPPTPGTALVLRGVITEKGQSRALVSTDTDGGTWLSAGGKVGGWTIESISADAVSLRQGRQVLRLSLYEISPNATAARNR
jgi:hypothetical protein